MFSCSVFMKKCKHYINVSENDQNYYSCNCIPNRRPPQLTIQLCCIPKTNTHTCLLDKSLVHSIFTVQAENRPLISILQLYRSTDIPVVIVIVWQPLEHILARSYKTAGDKEKFFYGNMSGYARLNLWCHSHSAVVNDKARFG